MLNSIYLPLFQQTTQWLEKVLLAQLQDASHYRLLQQALSKIRREFTEDRLCPAITAPALVYATLKREPDEALAILSAAHLAFYLFLDLTDDVEDHDLTGPPWHELGTELALNTGTSCLFLSHMVLEGLNQAKITGTQLNELRAQFTKAGWALTVGQHRDLFSKHQGPLSAEAAWKTVALKSGTSVGLYFSTAALIAQAALPIQQTFAQIGHLLGQFLQVRGDYQDLLKPRSSDLRNGYQTVPLAVCYERLDAPGKATLLVARQQAQTEDVGQDIVRHLLCKSETAKALNQKLEQQRQAILSELEKLNQMTDCDLAELQFFVQRAHPLVEVTE